MRKSDLVVKFKNVSIKNSPSGGKLGVSFDVTVTHPPVDDRRGEILSMVIYEKMDGKSWQAIATNTENVSAPFKINDYLKVIDNGQTSRLNGFVRMFAQEPGASRFSYAVYVNFGNNLNPNCNGPHFVNLSYKGGDESKITPPCPTNVHPIKTEDLGQSNVEYNQVMLAWDFDWPNKPRDAVIVYKYKITTESNSSGFERPDEFREKQALIQLLDTNGGKNIITILALDKTSGKISVNCKPVVFQNTEAGGPYIWIDQDGKQHDVKPGEFANPTNDETADSDGCSVWGIISAGGLGDIFSKFISCLFIAIFRPMIDWATELVQKAAGLSWIQEPAIYQRRLKT